MDCNADSTIGQNEKLTHTTLDEEIGIPNFNDTEFYCLDGGFASHLPTHYKVNYQVRYSKKYGGG